MGSSEVLGLTRLTTEQLKDLLRFVYREELTCPITPAQLAPLGFQGESESIMNTMRNLDAHATRAVLIAVIAERMERED